MSQGILCRISKHAVAVTIALYLTASLYCQDLTSSQRVHTVVNSSDRVMLAGKEPRYLSSARDLGAADSSIVGHHVTMVLQRTQAQRAALAQYLSDVQNPSSVQYHRWLTPAEYGSRFGIAKEDIDAVAAWLQSQGLVIERVSPAANMISFSGTISQLQSAFSTSIHSISVSGEKHLSNLTLPQIPRALSPVVRAVMGLNDFHPHNNVVQGPGAKWNPTTHHIDPNFTLFDRAGNPYLYLDPSDAATVYDTPNKALNPSYSGTNYDGTGVTVGVVGDTNVDMTPVANYRLAFLGETKANVNLPTAIVDGSDPGTNGDQIEAFLDLEVLGGIAPKAKINYYESGDTDLSAGLFDAIQRAVNDNVVSILSISYGSCEANLGTSTNAFLEEIYAQAAAQGITITVSSGDSGSAGCDNDNISTSASNGLAVNGLGSTPYNVSIGGTDFDVLGTDFASYVDATTSGTAPYWRTANKYIPENPWNDSTSSNGALAENVPLYLGTGGPLLTTDIIGAGGGKSSIYGKPAFQMAATPADGARDVPDVSFLSGNGLYGAVWVVCATTLGGVDCSTQNGALAANATFTGAGGTSASTPAFAGMLALVVQATGSRLGQANDVLYSLAANKYSKVFHDVTVGNNSVVCSDGTADCGPNDFLTGYDAGKGYDLASGLGSVDAAAMVANWSSGVGASSGTSLTINGATTPVSVTHGTSLSFAVKVEPSSATGLASLVDTDTPAAGLPLMHGQPFTIPVKAGAGSASYNGLPGGQYTVFATYGGDTTTSASQSQPISVNISPEESSTMLTINGYDLYQTPLASLNAVPYGYYLFVDTSVYGKAEGYTKSLGAASGEMTILDNGKPIGSSPITSGNLSSFPAMSAGVYPFAAGKHTVTASFPGDDSYKSNTSDAQSFTVIQGKTSVSLMPTLSSMLSTATNAVVVNIDTSSLGSAPTGTLTLTANGTNLGTTTSFLAQNQVADNTVFDTFTFNVPGTALQPGPNVLTASYSGDGNYTGSNTTATVTVTEVAFKLQVGPLAIAAGASSGNTAPISAYSYGGFAGAVNLTCAVTSTPANASNPVSCSVPSQLEITGVGSSASLLTIQSSSSTTGGTYGVTISGVDAATAKIKASTTTQVTVTQASSISLSNSGSISVNAGGTSGNTSTLTIAPINSFQGVVAMTCAVTSAPAGAVAPITCGISPSTVTISGSAPGTATLSIGSTAPKTAALMHPWSNPSGTAGGIVAAFAVILFVPSRRRKAFRRLMAVLLLAVIGAAMGCGGSGKSSSTQPAQPGTSAGAYVVTVTASPAGAATQTATVNVTVN